MKKSPSTTVLFVILVASALISVWFCGLYIRNALRLRDLQRTMAGAQTYRTLFISLVNDTIEYSKRNPAIEPLLASTPFLEAAGFKIPKSAAAVTNKPAGK